VDDGAIARRSDVDHFAHRRGVFVAGDDEGAGLYLLWIAGLVEEGPEVARFVFIVEVCGDVDAVDVSPPLARSCLERTGEPQPT
jgi:hypothetical protein